MTVFKRYGFRSKDLLTDLALGLTNGIDNSLWCYVYASLIFAGALSEFLPVGIMLILLGWVLVSSWVALTSREPLHLVETDDQAVVIFGSISTLMVVFMGDRASGSAGLATILCIIALTSLAFSLGCYLVSRYRLSRMLELVPYPVVCGFMASIGWLLLGAGFEIMGEVSISSSLLTDMQNSDLLPNLGLSMALGLILVYLTSQIDKSWILPAVWGLSVIGYYGVMAFLGMSQAEQQEQGWLFQVAESEGGSIAMLAALRPSDVDWSFIVTVIPQIATILFLAMLYVSMSLTALKAASHEKLIITEEFKGIARGNLFCFATCSPPGYTEVVGTAMYREFGASSRWMPLMTSFVGLMVLFFGSAIIGYLPKLLIGATIFLFAFQTLFQWLIDNVRGFSPLDYVIVLLILNTAIFFGFMTGILAGIIMTVLMFVMRYSMISAIQSRSTLKNRRSSVERSRENNQQLMQDGGQVVIYSLRGFLFFGTANTILDNIIESEQLHEGKRKAFLLDMSRVTGVDISALITFTQLMQACETEDVLLVYAHVPRQIREKLIAMDAVSLRYVDEGLQPLIFDEADFALEYLENLLLKKSDPVKQPSDVGAFIGGLVKDESRAAILKQAMQRRECRTSETLFQQGDPDEGLYLVESGALSAYIHTKDGQQVRVRKFKPGSLIGELSAYLQDKRRSATIVADEDSVLYQLSLDQFQNTDNPDYELLATIHELVASTLAERVNFMNSRLSGSL